MRLTASPTTLILKRTPESFTKATVPRIFLAQLFNKTDTKICGEMALNNSYICNYHKYYEFMYFARNLFWYKW
jgi:hypothetical protein